MNYKDIAKLVHDLVKNSQENNVLSTQTNDYEVAVIKRVFSELEVSGDIVSFGYIPLGYWA